LIYGSVIAQDFVELFARALFSIVHHNKTPLEALQEASHKVESLEQKVTEGVASGQSGRDDIVATSAFGIACGLTGGLPIIAHFISKYPSDYSKVLIANLVVGGDSASRAVLLGSMIAAHKGDTSVIPDAWLQNLSNKSAVFAAIDRLIPPS